MFKQAREVKETLNATAREDEVDVRLHTLDTKENKHTVSTRLLDQTLDGVNTNNKLQENKPPEVIHDYDDVKAISVSIVDDKKPVESASTSRMQDVVPVITTFNLRRYKNANPDVINNSEKEMLSNYSTTFDQHLERQEKDKEARRIIHMRKERMNLKYVNVFVKIRISSIN